MRSRAITLTLVTAACTLPVTASAQLSALSSGARVRLEATGVQGRLTGTVTGRTPDAVTLALSTGVPVTVPLASLTSLQVSRGRSRGTAVRRGLLWGGATGAVVGAVPIVAACAGSSGDCDAFLATAIPAGATTGALLGMAIGAAIGAERWEQVALPARVSIAPARGGGVSIAVRLFGDP